MPLVVGCSSGCDRGPAACTSASNLCWPPVVSTGGTPSAAARYSAERTSVAAAAELAWLPGKKLIALQGCAMLDADHRACCCRQMSGANVRVYEACARIKRSDTLAASRRQLSVVSLTGGPRGAARFHPFGPLALGHKRQTKLIKLIIYAIRNDSLQFGCSRNISARGESGIWGALWGGEAGGNDYSMRLVSDGRSYILYFWVPDLRMDVTAGVVRARGSYSRQAIRS